MSNNTDPDIRPGTEDRVAAAMRSLAATHTPDAQSASPAVASSRRWMLAVAASAVLVVGVGALLFASNRTSTGTADRLPQPATTTVSSEAADFGTRLPEVPPLTYSETPLDDNTIPVIMPPPAEPVNGFESNSATSPWTREISNSTTFAVLDGERVTGSIQLFDSPAPWDVISEGQEVTQINDHDVIRVDGSDERGFFIRVGESTRAVLDTSPPAGALSIDADVAALVAQIGDDPADRFDDNERFIRVPVDSESGRGISYGSMSQVQLVQIRLVPGTDADSIDVLTQLHQLSLHASAGAQVSTVVQVSPVDLVAIIARNDEELATATANLQLVSLDDSGVEFTSSSGFTGDTVVARGEPAWGRWQVTSDNGDGDFAGCQFFEAFVWGIDGYGRGITDCGERNPVRADGSRVFCVVLDVEIVGAVVGAATEPVVTVGHDIDGVIVDQEDTTGGEFGKHITFRVGQAEPGANIRAATVLVDGAEISCG